MAKAIAEIAIGAGLIALDIVAPELGIPATVAAMAAAAGTSLVISGIGTLVKKQVLGLSATVQNPIQPWNVIYGRAKVGATTTYIEETGESDKYLHFVHTLSAHPCQSVDAVLFDGKRVCLNTNGDSISFNNSTFIVPFPPYVINDDNASQQTVNIQTITRVNNVVTVVMTGPMPLPAMSAAGPPLMDGDTVQIQNVPLDNSLNGQFIIALVPGSNFTSFTYICGGNPISITLGGQVKTQWPDYGDTVHMEVALGNQTAENPPFPGLLASGDSGSQGWWTPNHLQQGRTAVYLRLKYGGNTYVSGIPSIGYLVHGKNDIYDPRTGGTGYTENSCLIIADYLCQQTWGFKCQYGAEVPVGPVIAGANICDETVPLAAGGTEPRYTCNGSFQLTAKRGEILQNLLTSCAGRISYSGGQFAINPGAWTGTAVMGSAGLTNANGFPATTAELYIQTTFIPATPVGDFGVALSSIDTLGVLGGLGWLTGPATGWTNQVNSTALAIDQLQNLTVLFAIGSSFPGTASTAAEFIIYDCWVQVTWGDGTTSVIRPTTASSADSDPFNDGSIANVGVPTPAMPVTIQRTHFDTLQFSPALGLGGFGQVGTLTVPVTPLTLNLAAGPFQWKPKLPVRDLYNGVKATYVSPLNSWQPSDMPPYAQDTEHGYAAPPGVTGYYDINVAADGGDRRWLDWQLPFTDSFSMAQRIAKIELLRRRQQGIGTFIYNLAQYQLTALDIVSMTIPYLDWVNKILEVSAHRFTIQKQDDNHMTLGTEIDLQEADPSVYDWDPAAEELSPEGYQQANLTGNQTVAAPVGVSAVNATTTIGGGITTGQIQVTWTLPTDAYVADGGQTLVQYSLDDVNWIPLGTFNSSSTSAYIPDVSAGQQYWIRVAFMNAVGAQSNWTVYGPLTATGSSLRRIDDETPAGAINGTNATFTLSQPPNPTVSLSLYLNGDLLLQGLDYSLSGNTITLLLTVLPNTGDWMRAFYWY